MSKALGFYVAAQIGVLILAALSFLWWDKRYRKNQGSNLPQGFEKTEELTVDPQTGVKLRVYYNSDTGERFYHEESDG